MVASSLLHYRIDTKLGQGGMGEVYLAHDTKLGREVAIKVLPDSFARDPERLARFEREARLLASLNHPNVGAIHGFEDADGTRFLVLELVPGETLSERLLRGAMPLVDALEFARQIADAAEHAHAMGIVHRDLKPDNVKITPRGTVKVLDFGLAKALDPKASSSPQPASPASGYGVTAEGVVLGTTPYMSPEQARGKSLDKRTDVWSFGCVLYEMLAGRRAFQGETVSDTIAAILNSEPDWKALPGGVPRRIRELLRRCLEKNPRRRLQDLGDARVEIEEVQGGSAETELLGAAPPEVKRARRWTYAAAIVLGAGLGALGSSRPWARASAPHAPVTRLSSVLPPDEHLGGFSWPQLALSPDGRKIAYACAREGSRPRQIRLRDLDRLAPAAVPGTEKASSPFFSPDGRWLGFFADGKLKKTSLESAAPLTLCAADHGGEASWGRDGTIAFSGTYQGGLSRVSADGGAATELTRLDPTQKEFGHWWPQILPDGKNVLYTIWKTSLRDAELAIVSLETGKSRIVLEGGVHGRVVSTGHLLFMAEGGLFAVSFDLDRLETKGSPVSVLQDVERSFGNGLCHFDVSRDGTLAYIPRGPGPIAPMLTWVSLDGRMEPVSRGEGGYSHPRVSRDGSRIVSTKRAGDQEDVWVLDLARGAWTRLTTDGSSGDPIWTADSKRIVYESIREGPSNLYWVPADGSAPEEAFLKSGFDLQPADASADGRAIAYIEDHSPESSLDLGLVPLEAGSDGKRPTRTFAATPFTERAPRFSPDGKWLAYYSDESGSPEVYVQAYPGPGGKWRISTDTGWEPVWSPDGKEIYYLTDAKMMAVAVRTEPEFAPEKPRVLFEGRFETDYDIAPDGKRFVMVRDEGDASSSQIVVVQNWFEELERLAPVGR